DPLPKGAVARIGTLRFCQALPVSVAFSPDGKVLASGGYDNRIRLWDQNTGKEVRNLEGHKSYVNSIAFSGDGKWLASGGQDNELILWEVATGKARHRIKGSDTPVFQIALSPNGKALASFCGQERLRLWVTATGEEIWSLPAHSGGI